MGMRSKPFHHLVEPVLGTTLHVVIGATTARAASAVLATLLGEIDRLERIYSVFDPTSELNRWKVDSDGAAEPPVPIVSRDLLALLDAGERWMRRTESVFNPNLGPLTARWRQAEREAIAPSPAELDELVTLTRKLPYELVDTSSGQRTTVRKVASCAGLDFNALAKGMIVDAATRRACDTHQIDSLMVNIGGDLCHRGSGTVVINVEPPDDHAANATPVTSAVIANCASATSGDSWRGFNVAGRRLGHVIDSRTGWPSTTVRSATVVAEDAATADVLATVLSVLDSAHGLKWLNQLDHAAAHAPACFVIDTDGRRWSNPAWDLLSVLPTQ
jgi:FAD:protein FMN transferase